MHDTTQSALAGSGPPRPPVATRLAVFTSRLAYQGPDRLDVSRYGNHRDGVAFAPSLELLHGFKSFKHTHRLGTAAVRAAFAGYAERYRAEMALSRRTHAAAWDALLARERVVLCCYCFAPQLCHRGVLADLLVALGATYEGEA